MQVSSPRSGGSWPCTEVTTELLEADVAPQPRTEQQAGSSQRSSALLRVRLGASLLPEVLGNGKKMLEGLPIS